jgi:pyruvate/2-oxoglutarate dehydrogenase complex dihydrolipoamide acyltransferase (E2) component
MANNIDILLKLFATLKESSDKNEEATKQLILQQLELVGHIKHLPIDDLRQALKEHAKDSEENIDACTETVEVTGKDLMEEIKKLASKVNKMILIVLVTFTILTGAYVVIRSTADNQENISTISEAQHHKIDLEIIRKEIRRLHDEDENKGQ